MKKITIIAMLVSVTVIVYSQAQEKAKKVVVPEVIKQAFVKKFPNAEKVGWSMESPTEYEAEFKLKGVETSSNFDQQGKWLVTETEIKSSQLPAAIQAILKKDFAGYKVEESEKIETSASEVFYEVALEKGESNLEIKFSPDGKIMKREEKEEEKD